MKPSDLLKTAAPVPEEQGDPRVRAGVTAAAGASPFLGLIGDKPQIHDPLTNPNINRFGSAADLSRAARPGDVIVYARPGKSRFKDLMRPTSGTEFFHTEPVIGTRGGHGIGTDAGLYSDLVGKSPSAHREMAEKMVSGEGPYLAETVRSRMRSGGYDHGVLLRPRQPMTPQQQKEFAVRAMERSMTPYDERGALRAWFKDIFVPKVGGGTQGREVVCSGNVCSTAPAQALEEVIGTKVAPGVRAKDTMPRHFLTSEAFEPVGAFVDDAAHANMSPAMRKALPYLTRAGIGAGLAGAAYLGYDHPEYALPAAGAVGGAVGMDALIRSKAGQKALARYGVHDPLSMLLWGEKQLKGSNLKRTVGALGAGAGLGLGAGALLASKLRQARRDRNTPIPA